MDLWDATQPSLFDFLSNLKRANGGILADSSVRLPDETPREPGAVGWAPGAIDGVGGHHSGYREPRPERVLGAIRSATARRTAEGARALYDTLLEEDCLPVIDAVIDGVTSDPGIDRRRLRFVASFIARRSPQRVPVKFAIALLGAISARGENHEIFATFGLHEEFALYAVVALWRSARDPEDAVWSAAKATRGWGRIAAVERLDGSTRPEIKRWLLLEGYKNEVMYEYTALICAMTGGLAEELAQPFFELKTRSAAADIIRALLSEGPAAGVSRYADASLAMRGYVSVCGQVPIGGRELTALLDIQLYLHGAPTSSGDRLDVWTEEERKSCLSLIGDLVAPLRHSERLRKEVAIGDPATSHHAEAAARRLGLDVWPEVFDRLRSNPLAQSAPWWAAMRTDDSERVRAVVSLAEEVLPLDRIASGPALHTWPTRDVVEHGALDYVLQDLDKHPSLGGALIRAGLRSPVVRNRNMALKALSIWPLEGRSVEWSHLLDAAHAVEPDQQVKARIEDVRSGRPLNNRVIIRGQPDDDAGPAS